MKNIETILAELGIELTDEQKRGLTKGMAANYKPIADYDKQKEKLTAAEKKVVDTEEALKKFDGVDADALKNQIKELQEKNEQTEKEYQTKLSDRNFNDILKDCIGSAKGKNAKAITALLDLDTLKASKNQKDDIASAIKSLTEGEDSKMLFGEPEATVVGEGNVIGKVGKTTEQPTSLKDALSEKYKK